MTRFRQPPALRRRQILKALGGLGIGMAAGGLMAPRPGFAAQRSGEPLMRPIPASGETVPAVGLGTARTYSLAGLGSRKPVGMDELNVSESQLASLREVLEVFHAEGGRVVDSSPMYGTAEELVGRFAKELGIVDELFMATKVWTDGREQGMRQMERSMELLRSEPLDIMLIHNLHDWRTHYPTLRDWQEKGRLRYIGVSHSRSSAHDEVEKVLRAERFDVLQINYNVLDTHADERLLPYCREKGLATMINEPFENGALFRHVRGHELPAWAAEFDAESWAQVFLKFIIGHPAVTCAIPATSKPKHARDNTRAMYGRVPDEKQRRQIAAHLRAL